MGEAAWENAAQSPAMDVEFRIVRPDGSVRRLHTRAYGQAALEAASGGAGT